MAGTHSMLTWILYNTLNSTSTCSFLKNKNLFSRKNYDVFSNTSTTRIFVIAVWFSTNGTNLNFKFCTPKWPMDPKGFHVHLSLVLTYLDKSLVTCGFSRWWWSQIAHFYGQVSCNNKYISVGGTLARAFNAKIGSTLERIHDNNSKDKKVIASESKLALPLE